VSVAFALTSSIQPPSEGGGCLLDGAVLADLPTFAVTKTIPL
jgi:hypothetical protein